VTPVTLYRTAQQDIIDRRDKRRVQTDDPALLRLLKPFVPGHLSVRIVDVSKDGLRISTQTALEPGSLVHLRMRNSAVIAEVRHCSASPDGFLAGLQVDSVTKLHA
jgi:hypothetical protein